MRRLLFILALLIGCTSVALAQGGNTTTITDAGAPVGSCAFVQYYIDNTTPNLYYCPAGSWLAVTSGGGGGGNVSNSGTPTSGQLGMWTTATTIKGVTLSQDCTIGSTGVITCTKTNNVAFGPFATQTAPCSIAQGCTNATTAGAALTSLGAAASGANSDITSLSGLTTPLTVAQGGSSLGTWTAHALPIGNATSAPNFLSSPTTNGNCIVGFNVTGAAAVDPTCALSGIPVNAQSGNYTVLYSDRASYIKYSGGTTATLTLPQITGATASNFPFVTQNLNSGNQTLTANAADKIDNGSTGGSATVLPNWSAFVYQDSSSAPGNWWTIKMPTFAAFGSTGALCSWSTTTGAFTCGDLTGDVTTSGSKATTVGKINGTSFAGTNGDLVSFGASNVPADSGVVAANVVTAASNYTNGNLVQAAGANKTTSDSGVATTSLLVKTTNDYVGMGGFSSSTPSGTLFIDLAGHSSSNATFSNRATIAPRAMTFTGISVLLSAAEGASATLAFTLVKCTPSGSPPAVCSPSTTALTCTVGNSATTCSQTGQSVAVASGDLFSVQMVQSGTGTSQIGDVSVTYF